jgi:ABC-type nitrate/sulfonate/bicarbonate transport system permease component
MMRRETQLNGLIFLASVLFVWECIAQAGLVSPLIVPPPSKILQSFASLVWSGQIPLQILASMKRAAAGYLLAALVCVPVGILMGLFDRLYEALEVLVEMLRPIPPPVMIPVAMLFFGLGDGMKIFVIFFMDGHRAGFASWHVALGVLFTLHHVGRDSAAHACDAVGDAQSRRYDAPGQRQHG